MSIVVVLRAPQSSHMDEDGHGHEDVPEGMRVAPDIKVAGVQRLGDSGLAPGT